MATFSPYEPETDPGVLADHAAQLIGIAGRITGHGVTVTTAIGSGAMEFSEMIAEPIRGVATENEAAWTSAMQAAIYGAAVAADFAADILEYEGKIDALKERWHEGAVRNFGAGHDTEAEGFDADFDAGRAALLAELNAEAKAAKSDFETAADDRKADLDSGPTAESIQRLIDEGMMPWFMGNNLWGDAAGTPPAVLQREYADKAEYHLNGGADGELDEADLRAANRILGAFGEYADFSYRLMDNLGAQGLLETAGRIGAGGFGSDLTAEIQANLGVALATATDPDNGGPSVGSEWIQELMNAGGQDLQIVGSSGEGNYGLGYYALAPLLLQTDRPFAPELLVPVTEHMMRLDERGAFMNPSMFGMSGADANRFDPTGRLNGSPLNAGLTAMNNNPESATIFFSENGRYEELVGEYEYQVYGHAFDDDAIDDNLTHLIGGQASHHVDMDLVGDAFEAAVTGLPAGTAVDGDRPRHTEDMITIMERAIEYVAEHPERFDNDERAFVVMDNFANASVHYMEDIHRLFSDEIYEWMPEPHGDRALDVSDSKLENWFNLIGGDVEAAGTVWGGSQALVLSQIAELPPEAFQSGAGEISEVHGLIAGALHSGMYESLHGDVKDEAELRSKWIFGAKAGLSLAGGFATGGLSLAAGAAAGVPIGWGIDALAGTWEMSPEEFNARVEENAERYNDDYDEMREGAGGEHIDAYRDALIEANPALADATVEVEDENGDMVDYPVVDIIVHNHFERYWENVEIPVER
ncbi:hypothetical protein LX16_3920 [Stackebrandtia albiflava]|uniref:Uncharacterized protein n=1 Tax=Stackebrandtia albiflava TaxID=406432 RepID=A0A562UY36_9ACTN|nr:hypothetical protein [Stackebrandtia albiflava]TWJ10503.1 hypothetical protein LX16_3920 [Stackebrandtia albiflava]